MDTAEPTKAAAKTIRGRKLITAQHYLDDDIAESKQAAGDYVVSAIELDYDGVELLVVYDGNHSLEAAIRDGVEIEVRTDEWAQQEADRHNAEWVLQQHASGEYVDAFTRQFVW